MRIEVTAKRFGERRVLGPLALTLHRGERVALTGPSGIGKSTLLAIVAGLDRTYDGRIIDPLPTALVFQEPLLLPWRPALANITLTTGVPAEEARALMAEVGLEGYEDAFPGQLSLGQQRRLSLARAFAARPGLLAMDEPFASLDAETADRMRRLTLDLLRASGAAVLLVTHDPQADRMLFDRTVVLGGAPAGLVAPQ